MASITLQDRRASYAPIIVAGSLFGLVLSFAPLFNMAVFMKPLIHAFGWSRTQVAGGTSVATLGMALAAPWVGRLIDRFGARRVILVSAIGFCLSLAGLAALPNLYPVFLLLAAMVGVTGAGTSPLAYLALVARWFDRGLGRALGISMVGVGVGIALSPIVGNVLLAHFGLRGAFLGMAGFASLAIPNALWVLREPEGDREPAGVRQAAPATFGGFPRDALGKLNFWLLVGSVFLMTLVVAGCGVHLIALLTDGGYSAAQAAGVASLVGVALLLGRLCTGFLLDRFPIGPLAAMTFVGGAAGAAIFAVGLKSPAPMVAALLLGFAQGSEGDVVAFAARRLFPPEAYGSVYGLIFAAYNLGVFGGPLLMGQSFDRLGSYQPGLWTLTAIALAAAALVARVRPRA
jgi:OFA family oxalate/formate antiporter-like MFS transporter